MRYRDYSAEGGRSTSPNVGGQSGHTALDLEMERAIALDDERDRRLGIGEYRTEGGAV